MSTAAATQAAPGPPTFHHLNHSQSQRVFWLLEELGIEYNLVLHKRDAKTKRAPAEMEKIHPLGKSPMLVTADGRTIVETPAIVSYLLTTYDTAGKFASADALRDETLSSYAGSSLGMWAAFAGFFSMVAKSTPWPFSYATRAIKNGMDKNFLGPEFKKSMVFLTGELGEREWFNGAEPGKPDFLLSWPFDNVAQWGWIDLEKEYPELAAWRRRVLERPAWKRAIEKGNGYDLVNMP